MAANESVSEYSKDNPFPSRIVEARLLNKPGSSKETRHFVVSLAGSGLHYKSGDSLGVHPSNRESEVAAILRALKASGEEPVRLPRTTEPIALREAITSRLALADPTPKFVAFLAARASDSAEKARLSDLLVPEAHEILGEYLENREFVDLLEEYPSALPTAQEFVDHLRKLMPRLYSIASSPKVHPEEVHLTVAIVRYRTNGRERVGVCSTFLADRVKTGATPVPVFVSHSHFGLPEDPRRDVIMVGPGTGIAPFRAFVQERAAIGASGRNWLFYGDQHAATDFLYGEEWQSLRSRGVVSRLDTAFSRDQLLKIYVQDRMRENAAELWSWLSSGAYFYVCGDARRMAKDVDTALLDIVAGEGRMSPAEAAEFVKQMKKERRYQRDVY